MSLNISPIGSGGGVWGAITGTLSNQTDLQTALNANSPTTITLDSATYTLAVDNQTTFSTIGTIAMPAMPAGSRFTIVITTKNTSGVSWEFAPQLNASNFYVYRDASAGADDTAVQVMSCFVVSSSSILCSGTYLRRNATQGALDWNVSGLAIQDLAYNATSAWTLNYTARTLANTTVDITFSATITYQPAI